MRKIMAFILMFTSIFPASIFACPDESCIHKGLDPERINEELLNEIRLITEDGKIEAEEIENLSMLLEQKWGISPFALSDLDKIFETSPIYGTCVQALSVLYTYVTQVPHCVNECLSRGDYSCIEICLGYLIYIPLGLAGIFFDCWYFFLTDSLLLGIFLIYFEIILLYFGIHL